ncbi:MAG: MipA/OmpV family protein [Hyphomonadaceae bacterium]|nr:MipA/OmpV family protein [Hyphomonadaceae bacterium]
MKHAQHVLALLTVVAGAAILPQAAYAQDTASGPQGYLALGAAVLPEYEGADAGQTLPFVAARVAWGHRYVAVEGVSARANLLDARSWEAGPVASITFGRDDDVDSVRVARLVPVDDAIELGGFVARTWDDVGVDGGEARLEWRATADAGDAHGGWQSTVTAGYGAPLGARWRVGADVSVTVVNDAFADTYFSVTPADALASGLPTYRAEGGAKDVGVSANAVYAMTETWSITGFVGYRRLLGDAADSPIVRVEGAADQISAGVGVGFSF